MRGNSLHRVVPLRLQKKHQNLVQIHCFGAFFFPTVNAHFTSNPVQTATTLKKMCPLLKSVANNVFLVTAETFAKMKRVFWKLPSEIKHHYFLTNQANVHGASEKNPTRRTRRRWKTRLVSEHIRRDLWHIEILNGKYFSASIPMLLKTTTCVILGRSPVCDGVRNATLTVTA